MAILEGRFSEGDTIVVDAKDGQITITGAEPRPSPAVAETAKV
jgi:hypothetical protein